MLENRVKKAIRDVPDFPKPGILFRDISPLLADPILCNDILDEFCHRLKGQTIDAIAAIESRGFLFGFTLANRLQCPFILIRKSGKLPHQIISHEYELEYGKAVVEMHVDAIKRGWNVLIHDDLLATGGTAMAAAELIKKVGGNIAGFAFIIELGNLKGRVLLSNYSSNINCLATYSE